MLGASDEGQGWGWYRCWAIECFTALFSVDRCLLVSHQVCPVLVLNCEHLTVVQEFPRNRLVDNMGNVFRCMTEWSLTVMSTLKASISNIKKQWTDCLCTDHRAPKRKAKVWGIIKTTNKGRTGLLLSFWNNKFSGRHWMSAWWFSPCLSFTTHSCRITSSSSGSGKPIYQGLGKARCCWDHDRPMDAKFSHRLYVCWGHDLLFCVVGPFT